MKTRIDFALLIQGFCVGIAVGLHAEYLLCSKFDNGLAGVHLGWFLYGSAFCLGAWRAIREKHIKL